MEENKKSNIGIIILVFVLLCAAFAGGYFVNEKGLIGGEKDTPKEEEKEEDKITVYDVTDSKIKALVADLPTGYPGNCMSMEKFANDKKVTVDDIDNVAAYNITSTRFSEGKFEEWPDTVSVEDFKKQVAKRFGKNYKFDVSDKFEIGKECAYYYYDKTNNIFKKESPACGWTCPITTDFELSSAVDTNGILKLNVKVYFPDRDNSDKADPNTAAIYADYARTKLIGKKDLYNNNFDPMEDEIFSKANTYEFTYKNEDDNYVFVSSELKK